MLSFDGANTELLHKSVALQYKCNKLDAKNKELKASVEQALNEIRSKAFGYANIEEDDEKTYHYTALPTYSVFTTLFGLLKPFVVSVSSKSAAKRTQLKINFMPHWSNYVTMFLSMIWNTVYM